MTDLAALGLSVRSDGVVVASDALDKFKRSSDRAAKGAGAVEKRSAGMGAALAKLGRIAAPVALAVGSLFSVGALTRGIAGFDSSMSRAAAVTRATQGDLQRLRETSQELGATTEFSAAQAADALTFLGMAGFSAADSVAALPPVLDLATASGMGLASAADTASNIMSAFGIAAQNAANVTDVLAAASTRANTNVAQLGQAISTAGPIAATLGIALEDTAAAIGVMSDAGIQGERAGTALRGVMAALAGPTTQAQEALARYALTAADVDPATRSLADIMDTLASSGLSTADAMQIFGREAASGALVMVQASDRLRTFGDELRNADGAASDMAATMRDNLRGDLDGASSALQGLVIALGDAGLTAVLRSVIQGITSFVRGLSLIVSQVGDAIGAVNRLFSEQARLEAQIDNTRIAIGDEIRAMSDLEPAMARGATMSVDMANKKLQEELARRGNIRSILDEQRALGMATSEYKDLSREIEYTRLQSENLRNTGRDGGPFAPSANRADIEFQLRQLSDLASQRQALLDPGGEGAEALRQNEQIIERLRSGIANAADGIVTFGDGVITTTEATERLDTALASLGKDGAAGNAGELTDEMKRMQSEMDNADMASERWANSMAGHFDGLITGGKDFSGVLMSIARQLESSAWQSLFSGNLFGGGGGGLFSGIGSFFSGLFDQGGMIPSGGVGIVGERGPEFVRGPAHVTSRADTARMMQGNSGGGQVVIKLDLSRDVEARIMRNTSGQAVQIVSSALGANRQALPGQIDTINNRGE